MKNKVIIVILVVVIVAVVGFSVYFLLKKPAVNGNMNITNTPYANIKVENEVIIKMASFNPSVLNIKVGQSVTWTNDDPYSRWVISDPHPKHDILPDLDSGKLIQGQSYSYTFKKAGEWGYHDELNPIKKGIIIVEE